MAKKSKHQNPGGWSSIPGEKLAVDIDSNAHHDEKDTYDFSKWTSPHYNIEDDDNSAASRDLYDPDPRAEGNRFNVEDGAGEFGMFYSLEVISGEFHVSLLELVDPDAICTN
jgi:hypothetical protein